MKDDVGVGCGLPYKILKVKVLVRVHRTIETVHPAIGQWAVPVLCSQHIKINSDIVNNGPRFFLASMPAVARFSCPLPSLACIKSECLGRGGGQAAQGRRYQS